MPGAPKSFQPGTGPSRTRATLVLAEHADGGKGAGFVEHLGFVAQGEVGERTGAFETDHARAQAAHGEGDAVEEFAGVFAIILAFAGAAGGCRGACSKGVGSLARGRQRDRTEGSGRGGGVLQESAARDSLLTIIGGAHGRTFRLGLGVVDCGTRGGAESQMQYVRRSRLMRDSFGDGAVLCKLLF